MKTKLLTICLLLVTSISWSGEIDGKSIICNKDTGYRFVSGMVEVDAIREFGIANLEAGYYHTNPDYISWRGGVRARLNRKTLVLEREYQDGYIYWKQCEVMPNIKEYNKQLEKYLQKYIKEFNRKDKILKKGNKI
ncbi:hypothetical protein N9A44_00500 [Gammaproteobacteria bacterium]|nr:hypothetical protein [Gammaproteobacteria bacterium]